MDSRAWWTPPRPAGRPRLIPVDIATCARASVALFLGPRIAKGRDRGRETSARQARSGGRARGGWPQSGAGRLKRPAPLPCRSGRTIGPAPRDCGAGPRPRPASALALPPARREPRRAGAWQAWLTSGLNYVIWFWGVEHLRPVATAVWSNLQPPVTAIMAWALLHEPLPAGFLFSGALVLGGVWTAQRAGPQPGPAPGAPAGWAGVSEGGAGSATLPRPP